MVYRNNLVACIKVGGKILRENQNVVTLPFGCEYSILLKNLNSVRALVSISIDGQDATNGTGLILHPNSDFELERYIRNGNFDRGNRFKFIERTGQIEGHRGIGLEDGLIRIEYKVEKVVREQHETIIRKHYIDEYEDYPWWPRRPWRDPWPRKIWCSTQNPPTRASGMRSLSPQARSMPTSASRSDVGASVNFARMARTNDAGITVPGSESSQQFVPGAYFPTETHSDVIVIKLRGEIGGQPVMQPVTVDRKPQCQTCGLTNKGTAQFCSRCGTSLQVV